MILATGICASLASAGRLIVDDHGFGGACGRRGSPIGVASKPIRAAAT
jgi:hypothetical protein